ncbi:MAG TPA: hypothetical protein VN769_12620 [Xanthobacteraceae bacterium]|nr:hypothetical protein [Xanthobacteraceae bacterium]
MAALAYSRSLRAHVTAAVAVASLLTLLDPNSRAIAGQSSNGFDFDSLVGQDIKMTISAHQSTKDTAAQTEKGDPFADITTWYDQGAKMSSATGVFGAVNGLSQASHTTDVGGGAEGSYNASKTFNLSADQRIVLVGLFRYDSLRTTFSPNPLLPTTLTAGSAHLDGYSVGGAMNYYVGSQYFSGYLTGSWGNGGLTNGANGATGSFNTDGYTAGLGIGKTFTLFGSGSTPVPALPTKAPPRPAAAGNTLQLNLSANISYLGAQVGGFTDNSGFVRGTEQAHFWDATGEAMLVATIPSSDLTWSPYLGVNVDQWFGYSDTLNIPTQAATAGDIISYGSDQTFLGTKGGISVRFANGLILGVEGYYKQSAEFQIAGGQAYVRYYFPE